MKKIPLFLMLFPAVLFAQSVSLERGEGGKLQDFAWNGAAPLSLLKEESSKLKLFLVQEKKENPFTFSSVKNTDTLEEELYFRLSSPPDYTKEASLKIVDSSKVWPFQATYLKITWQTNAPLLELVSASPAITRGGAALVVVRSEPRSNLGLLAFIDEENIPYYPQTFKKDGYYVLVFPWYMSHGSKWDKAHILAMDKAGNTSELKPRIAAKNRGFVEKRIMLGADYGTEKAKELGLSPEEAKKLETNINAINAALLAATSRTFDRWAETRLPFAQSIGRVVSNPQSVFSKSSPPLKKEFRITATFGDRRRYFFRNKQVRESVHAGKDMAFSPNMPVYSILDGTVVYADWNRGNGKTLVIDHGMSIYSFYAHNSQFKVKEGDNVKAGQQISISGTTGQSTGDHLHLSVIIQGMYIEPTEWMNAAAIKKQFVQPLLAAEKIANADNPPLPRRASAPKIKETWAAEQK